MTHLKSENHSSVQYWRLGAQHSMTVKELRSHLQERGFYVKADVNASRLSQLLKRCDQGLLSYEKYSRRELKSSLEARGLSVGTNKTARVQILEQADEDVTFDRSLDLPAELSLHVYTLLMARFP